jgi:GTP-binding protein
VVFSTVADIPGLVPGAHLNKGLGLSFLKYVECCISLLYVLDVSCSDPDLCSQLHILQNEMNCYQDGLSRRARLIVANKMDAVEAVHNENLSSLLRSTQIPVLPVSALHHWNIDVLTESLTEEYHDLQSL